VETRVLYVVRFTDKSERLPQRQQFLQAHLEWLQQHSHSILLAGALRPEPDEPPVGGLWIVNADSHAQVDALLRLDPFWVHDVRESYEILHLSKAFPDLKVPI
jgi:uncharacterized protein YciI